MSEPFVVPEINVGMFVSFFPNTDKGNPHLALVTEKGTATVTLRALGNASYHECVRHCDDPRVLANSNLHEYGSWDYTDDWKQEQVKSDALAARLSAIEARLPAPEPVDERTALQAECKVKGIEIQSHWNAKTLAARLREHEGN